MIFKLQHHFFETSLQGSGGYARNLADSIRQPSTFMCLALIIADPSVITRARSLDAAERPLIFSSLAREMLPIQDVIR